MVYFRAMPPSPTTNDSRYTGIKTISELASKPGWSLPITPQSATQVVGCTTVDNNTYVLANNEFVNGGGWATIDRCRRQPWSWRARTTLAVSWIRSSTSPTRHSQAAS